MPPRFTGSRACRRARSRCASEPASEPTILWKAAAMILSCSRAASMVRDESEKALLRLLRDLKLGRVLELHDTLERLESLAHTLAELGRAPLVLAEVGPQHLDPRQLATCVALLWLRRRERRAAQLDARSQWRQGGRPARRPHALLGKVGGHVAILHSHHCASVHARDGLRRLVACVGVVEVGKEQRVRVRRLLPQQRPVVADRPQEGPERVALRAALLGVVGLLVWAGGGFAEDEEAAAPRVPETDRGDELRPPPAQPGKDRPPPHRVEAVLLVV
eukprot:scaffold32391_cov76-Phaeocystis_antarctica.AAC.2